MKRVALSNDYGQYHTYDSLPADTKMPRDPSEMDASVIFTYSLALAGISIFIISVIFN